MRCLTQLLIKYLGSPKIPNVLYKMKSVAWIGNLNNWQTKRFFVDYSYLLVCSGLQPVKSHDKSIRPSAFVVNLMRGVKDRSHVIRDKVSSSVIDKEKCKKFKKDCELFDILDKIDSVKKSILSGSFKISKPDSKKLHKCSQVVKDINVSLKEEVKVERTYDEDYPMLFKYVGKTEVNRKAPEGTKIKDYKGAILTKGADIGGGKRIEPLMKKLVVFEEKVKKWDNRVFKDIKPLVLPPLGPDPRCHFKNPKQIAYVKAVKEREEIVNKNRFEVLREEEIKNEKPPGVFEEFNNIEKNFFRSIICKHRKLNKQERRIKLESSLEFEDGLLCEIKDNDHNKSIIESMSKNKNKRKGLKSKKVKIKRKLGLKSLGFLRLKKEEIEVLEKVKKISKRKHKILDFKEHVLNTRKTSKMIIPYRAILKVVEDCNVDFKTTLSDRLIKILS